MTDFERALRDADEVWGEETVSPRVERMLRRQLRERDSKTDRRGRGGAWALAAAAAVAVLVALMWPRGESPAPTRSAWGEFTAPRPCPGFVAETHDGAVVASSGACVLTEPTTGIVLEVQSPVAFHRIDHGVAVDRGTITFDVERRSERRRVEVSGGVIEILGTRFTVIEDGDRGSVHLEHGSIRFVPLAGEAVLLEPGETLHWPLPQDDALIGPEPLEERPAPAPTVVAEPEVAVVAPAPSASPSASRSSLRARVAMLRAQGRFAEAAELLRTLDAVAGSERERLSYERGALLTYRLEDRDAACAHWAAHRARFPQGAYAVEVQAAVDTLGCR